MIRAIVGNIGSGKTLTAVMVMSKTAHPVFSNVRARLPNVKNLEYGMIIKADQVGQKKDGTPIFHKDVNWGFWKQAVRTHGIFSICIDELHNILMSRRSFAADSICMIKWLAQIRKITGSSEHTDFIAISQEFSRIDVALRDLCSEIIYCEKYEKPIKIKTLCYQNGKLISKLVPLTYIINYYFTGHGAESRYWQFREFGAKTWNRRSWFLGNEYMQFYDSYQIVDFGEGAFL